MKFKNKYLSNSYNINVSKKKLFRNCPALKILRRTDIKFYVLAAVRRKERKRKWVALLV